MTSPVLTAEQVDRLARLRNRLIRGETMRRLRDERIGVTFSPSSIRAREIEAINAALELCGHEGSGEG